MNGKPLTISEVVQHVEQFVQKYPQYTSDFRRAKPGVMQRTWRKNGFNYLTRGEPVLFYRRERGTFGTEDAVVLGVYESQVKEGELTVSSFVCKPHFVKEIT